jgi:hypothetical protein
VSTRTQTADKMPSHLHQSLLEVYNETFFPFQPLLPPNRTHSEKVGEEEEEIKWGVKGHVIKRADQSEQFNHKLYDSSGPVTCSGHRHIISNNMSMVPACAEYRYYQLLYSSNRAGFPITLES